MLKNETATRAKMCANWMINEIHPALKRANLDITQSPVTSQHLSDLIERILDNTISNAQAKQIFKEIWNNPETTVDEQIFKPALTEVIDLVKEKLNKGNL